MVQQALKNSDKSYPSSKEDKAMNSFYRLLCIAKVYNKDWIPDFDNNSEPKWYVYYYRSGGRWIVGVAYNYNYVDRPSGVYFKTRELVFDALEKFREDFDNFYMIG